MAVPRSVLRLQVRTLRWLVHLLQAYFSKPIYKYYHHVPLKPSYTFAIPCHTSPAKGSIKLIVYNPRTFHTNTPPCGSQVSLTPAVSRDTKNPASPRTKSRGLQKRPCILNFHGGGFVLGTGVDDERWARSCTELLGAVVISVEYRLAPEYPFPTAVQDGVDALEYVREHSAELGIDENLIFTSGFSAGGNLAISVPMMASDLRRERGERGTEKASGSDDHAEGSKELPLVAGVISFYPGLNSIPTRDQKACRMRNPAKRMPKILSNLFDPSYKYPATLDQGHPYLSPGVASDELLARALPRDIWLLGCQDDMLYEEGRVFAERLGKKREEGGLEKEVRYRCVEDTVHAWDKSPNPVPKPEPIYAEICAEVREILQ
ncbi:hypothetical protein BP6252_00240 [Coleophoma cylindrospora]|uniref:Alpha/beta hydrolase fold-3 domain-containing protein n=1 Tax=Coleophoma cylindrospora TaxID=1849047 RepID=A0A3D8SQY2_9HELO|nr:hypothetical protein BP6252_00240 [Coleophoma cylindrospora]